MAGPEKLFENKIKKYLKEHNIWFVKTWGGGYQRSGLPDIIACVKGHFVAIEVKAEKGKLSKLQEHELFTIRESGGYTMVLYPEGYEEFKKFIDILLITS